MKRERINKSKRSVSHRSKGAWACKGVRPRSSCSPKSAFWGGEVCLHDRLIALSTQQGFNEFQLSLFKVVVIIAACNGGQEAWRTTMETRKGGKREEEKGENKNVPLSSSVLDENGHEALERTEDGAMDDDRVVAGVIVAVEVETEALRQLEVELDGGALMGALEGIEDLNVDLGTVESTVLGVDLPVAGEEVVEGLGKGGLGLLPSGDLTQVIVGHGGQVELELESKDTIDVAQEVEGAVDLLLDLLGHAENVGVVLLEAADAGQASEGTRELVTMEDTKVGETDGQLTVGALAGAENQAVTGAVHGLDGPILVLALEGKHTLLVVLPVTRGTPQVNVVNVGGDDLLEATAAVLGADELLEAVVNAGAVREHEGRARGVLMPHEELLVLSNETMVTLRSKTTQLKVLIELLLLGEGDTIDALQRVVLLVSLPVGRGVVGHREGLDLRGVREMRATAQVDEGTTTVGSANRSVRDLIAQDLDLVLVILEHLQSLLLRDLQTLEGLLLTDGGSKELLELLVVLVSHDSAGLHSDIVVETTILQGGTSAEMRVELALEGLAEDVSGRVPEDLLGLRRVPLEDRKGAISRERAVQVPKLIIDLRGGREPNEIRKQEKQKGKRRE